MVGDDCNRLGLGIRLCLRHAILDIGVVFGLGWLEFEEGIACAAGRE